ncbi:MAG: S41 family peptidase [Gemmatimonadales bacterium]
MRAARFAASFVAALAGLAGTAQAQQPAKAFRTPTLYEDLQAFSQVLNQIRVNHLDSVDTHRLVMAAIEGMVRAADPHSYLIPVARLSPEKAAQYESGKLIPVPVAFRYAGGAPVVAAVAPHTKAARLDILIGDELVAIDSQPVAATSPGELEIALAGQKGSRVTLELIRQRSDGSTFSVERSVERERPSDETAVPVSLMLDAETGYVRITSFDNAKVAGDFHDALGKLKDRGMRRLVLDLRNNGGGLVDEAAAVAGEFLPSGSLLYVTESRKGDKPDSVKVKRSFWKKEERYPMVVLVDDGTASAAELVAGALQDHDRALLVGRTTFGKALLMRGFPLLDGSVIVMAFGRVKTPCGRVVQREYRSQSRRDYWRLAGTEADTAGRPRCNTAAGRTVYGGGGVHPDVVLPEPHEYPAWLGRLLEEEAPLRWAGGFATGQTIPTAEALAESAPLAEQAIASFREFVRAREGEVPAGPEADRLLRAVLLRQLAYAKFGDGGYYQVATALDPVVREAVGHFARAAEVLPR